MQQPHEGISGTDRAGDPIVSLEDDHLPVREALVAMAQHLSTATLVGNPAPVVARMGDRIRSPRVGDLVREQTTAFMRRPGWHRGVGYLVGWRREWWHTDEEWATLLADGEYAEGDQRPTDDAWYIQYGPAAGDICRWTNCSFVVIPIDIDTFSLPAGERDGSRVTFTRDSVLGGLADSGITLRTPSS